jgi:thiol:disulfide interchange protein DsbD
MQKITATLVLLIAFVGTFFSASAQLEFPEDKVSWNFYVEQKGCEATIIGKIKVVDHWHINATKLPKGSFGFPTGFELKKSPNFKTDGGVIEPKPIEKYDELADENLAYHEGSFLLKRKIKILSKKDFEITGTFTFQTCDDVKCLPDHTATFKVKVKGCESADEAALIEEGAGDETSSDEVVSDVVTNDEVDQQAVKIVDPDKEPKKEENNNKSLLTIFILSFISGLAALLTPCVFPMIPMTVSFFTKQSKSKAQGIKNAIIYGISIIVIYILLGTVVTAVFGAEALNAMSTNPTFNIVFFIILVVFAVSFLGAFEIRMPSSWVNKADSKADKGGLIGIFFMALALALVSFSCTGPIVGTLLVQAAAEGGVAPFIGMFGFSLALALPFGLFAAFPGWMNTLPKSGGWLNSVKVVLGFLELALAFKFLSNADLAVQAHYLEREVFLAIWIAIFFVLTLYLFGMIKLPHDSPLERLSVGRTLFGTFTLIFVLYMLPGMWGAPLKLISAFPPPIHYSESPQGFGGNGGGSSSNQEMVEGMHIGPQNINVFHDYNLALAYAKKVNKPLFVDFTGHNCVNCRKMEMSVWSEPGIIETLKNDVVIVSLHVDERIPLPADEQIEVEFSPGKKKVLRTTGDKWMFKQINEYQVTAQPYYVMQTPDGVDMENGSADFENHSNPADFQKWLDKGMTLFGSKK